jgi:hypothetical protein
MITVRAGQTQQTQPIDEANGPIAVQLQRVCHRPRPWLISISLGLMTRIVIAFLLIASVAVAQRTPGPVPDGMPFGRIEDADVDQLQEFATSRGFDLKAEMARVYSRDNKLDEDALGRVFFFSRQFNALDKKARTYGQIIFSSLLNIGEGIGVPAYVKIIDRQPTDVQQRIRDFLCYPIAHQVPKTQWKATLDENRRMEPGLFPKDFQFGHGDPIFAK